MVSFSCEGCGDVLTKKKLDSHRNQCHGASYTCLDCMVDFWGTDYRSHTSCISEAQKYQGALYKEKKTKSNGSTALTPHRAYVEDVDDDYTGAITIVDPPPEAPSPPSAVPGFTTPAAPVNVFDFFVGSETPNQSTLNLAAAEERRLLENTPSGSGAGHANGDDARVYFEDEVIQQDGMDEGVLVQYGSGPVPTDAYRTPAPKVQRERERKVKLRDPTTEEKKDKKRKRLHVDTSAERSRSREPDEIMTDAPPVLHSGLTGGLNRLLSRPSAFPPSPDYSGGDAGDASPGSPLKKTKHSKHSKSRRGREGALSNGIMSLITTRKSAKRTDTDRPRKSKRHHRSSDDHDRPTQKLLEYKPLNGDAPAGDDSQQLVLYRQQERAELFMSFINKGPNSERGVSMNKALKRYHRERTARGQSAGKAEEEKQLWRSLRFRQNDRGEVVLFFAGM